MHRCMRRDRRNLVREMNVQRMRWASLKYAARAVPPGADPCHPSVRKSKNLNEEARSMI